MSQRNSGYERKERDLYETPEWVTLAIKVYIPEGAVVWEPACASGKIARVLLKDHIVVGSDLVTDWGTPGVNFLHEPVLPGIKHDVRNLPLKANAIVTNPPFNKEAENFIRHGISLLKPVKGFMAMLLPVDFDSGKTRRDMFADCGGYAGKLVLTSRIVWFKPEPGAKGKSPSQNHAWFMWDFSKKKQKPGLYYHFKD